MVAATEAATSLRDHHTLQELVYRDLRARILAGQIRPGQRLRATAIGKELGVSPTPAREAIRRLQEQGLVTVRQRRGAVVTELSVADVAERYLVRMALEPLAAREGVAHLTPVDLDAMDRHIAEMERALVRDDRVRFLDHDQAFRAILFKASGLDFLCQLISMVWDGVSHHQRAVTALLGQAERYLENYRRLLLAARAGDAGFVETIIRDDLEASRQGLIRFLKERKQTPDH
jgi:DNA-binding GntR family transcriptional regulator